MINVGNLLQQAYINNRFPHSTSILGKHVEEIRQRSILEAQAYLFAFLDSRSFQFDARDNDSWKGFISGLVERHSISTNPPTAYKAAVDSIEDLHAKTERLLADKQTEIDKLHRDYETLRGTCHDTEAKHRQLLSETLTRAQREHEDLVKTHQGSMVLLQKTFRENMTLRAPVEYWEQRVTHHKERANILGWWSFGSMGLLAASALLVAFWVLSDIPPGGTPQTWKVVVLALVGTLGIWAVRLIVRIFLSHTHLATDASERVVMVKTYLALLEGDKLPSDDDRKLILQTLFRSASDGIVKDEGLPHPGLELLTKLGK
jgi:hypothetical protein